MRLAGLLVVVLIGLPVRSSAADFKDMFLKHWLVAREFTLAVAEAMPAEDYDFKPNPDQLTFGRLMTHIAGENSASCARATRATPLPEPAVNDKASALRFLSETFDTCARALAAMPPEEFDREAYKFQGEPVLAREALWYGFTHMAHHRGQAEVYLRIKNIKPPAWRF